MKIIDLSILYEDNSFVEHFPPKIKFVSHEEQAQQMVNMFNLKLEDFPDGMAVGVEVVEGMLHVGTHMDAPLHFGPYTNGKEAKTIDQMPLEWFYCDGVVIDVRHVQPGAEIIVNDLEEGLKKIGYTIKPFDIVLIMTGWDKFRYEPRYLSEHPGMSREATLWLLDQGVKVIGIDTWSFDRAFPAMIQAVKEGKPNAIMPAHFVGREREYCHAEKLGNLDKIPVSYGFKVIAFPQNVKGGTGGAIRPVAIIEDITMN